MDDSFLLWAWSTVSFFEMKGLVEMFGADKFQDFNWYEHISFEGNPCCNY